MGKENLNSIVDKFVVLTKETFGENLCSIILYGSANTGDYIPGVSDINLLILLKESNPKQIFSFGKKSISFLRKNRVTPQILTKKEFLGSSDIFPLEYWDLKANGRILFGEQILDLLSLDKSNLRHQVESLLRGSIGTLRQILVAAGGKEKDLYESLKIWSGSQKTVFKGLLKLKDQDLTGLKEEAMIQRISELYQCRNDGFLELEEIRHGKKLNPLDTAEKLLHTLIQLAGIVDSLEENK